MLNSASRRSRRLVTLTFVATLAVVWASACGGNSGDSAGTGGGPAGGMATVGGSGGSANSTGGGSAAGGRVAGGGSSTGGASAGGGNGAGGFQFPGSEDCPETQPENGGACEVDNAGGDSGLPGGGGLFCPYGTTFCVCSTQSSEWTCLALGSGSGGGGPGPGGEGGF